MGPSLERQTKRNQGQSRQNDTATPENVVRPQQAPVRGRAPMLRCPERFRSVKSGSHVAGHHFTQEKLACQPGQLRAKEGTAAHASRCPAPHTAGRDADTSPDTNPEAPAQIQKPKAELDDPRQAQRVPSHPEPLGRFAIVVAVTRSRTGSHPISALQPGFSRN